MLLTSSYLDMTTESSQSASNRAAASLHRMQRNKLNGGGVNMNTSLQSVVAANSEPHLSASNSTTNIMFDNRTGLSSTKGSINRLNRSYGSGLIGGANELTETVPDWATTTSFDDETRMNFSDVGEQSQQQPTTTTAALLILSKQRSSNHASNKQLQTLDAKKSKPHHLDYVRHLRHNEELMKKTSSSNRDNKMNFLNTPQQQQRNWKVSSKKGEADLMSSLEAISAANSGGESSSKRSSKNSSSHHTLLIGGAVDGIVSSSENFAANNQSSNSNLLESDSILMQMKKKSVINESKIRKLLKQKV
jgi:hypothetical protein